MTTVRPGQAPRLRMTDAARARGSLLAKEALPREAGGILLGWHEGETIVVTDVISVSDPRARTHCYVRNHKAAQESLDAFRANTADPNIGYVGEWHSHPAQQPPSEIDFATLTDIAHVTPLQVAMAVFSVNLDGSVTPHLVTATKSGKKVAINRDAAESPRSEPT